MNAILTKNLTKQYGQTVVVNGIDLTVEAGELYGFLGRNGAGKSTFINMMTGIIFPTSGNVALLNSFDREPILREIGVLPDYSTFYDHMTANQHLKYFSSIMGYNVTKQDCKSVLDLVGLGAHDNHKVGKFSFGMKKKLGIAQAIIHKPKLVFLDEPTSGIDAESAIQIQRLLQRLNQEGMTIFMTSHNLSEVEKICTRMAIMQNGNIAAEGTLSELQKKHSSVIKVRMTLSDNATTLHNTLEQLVGPIDNDGPRISFGTEDEKAIGEVVRMVVHQGMTVYRIETEQPSLEDIFLSS